MIGIEQIAPSGKQKYDLGEKGVFVLGEYRAGVPLLVAEGFSTAASLKKISGWNAACCGGTANIRAAVETLRKQFTGEIFVAPDTGAEDFTDVADVIEIPSEHPKNTDWNDLACSLGIEAAKDIFKDGWTNVRKRKQPETSPEEKWDSTSFALQWIGDLPLVEPEFLVDDLFEADNLSLFFGESGCKKSFVAFDLAASIATGAPFYGKQTKEGPVIYIAGEGNAGMIRRREAWSRHRGIRLKGV
ncbi:MAG: bifunctional DNA primase/helicase, partial [Synergistales bacterium]|nr:bifunctional DNA primase/helicase [Synergistales bacterium]